MIYFDRKYLIERFGSEFSWKKLDQYITEISDNDLAEYLSHCKKYNSELFIGWIENNQGIKALLEKGSTTIRFKDDQRVLEHTQGYQFQCFISPFLTTFLLKSTEPIDSITLSYLPLIEKEQRMIIEDQVYKSIHLLFNEVRSLKDSKIKEDQLIQALGAPLDDTIVDLVNSFSRSSYALRLNYVDEVLDIINSKACTVRLANWLLKKIERIELNKDHVERIVELKNELRTGDLKVRNVKTKGFSLSIKPLISGVLLLSVIALISYLILYKPLSDPDDFIVSDNSSFQEFSIEERKQLDSLLKEMQPNREFKAEATDLNAYFGEELELIIRDPYLNDAAESYYQNLRKDLDYYELTVPDTCDAIDSTIINKYIPNGFKKIAEKTTGRKSFFKNESDYDLQIIVFKNTRNSEAYYTYLESGEETTLNLLFGDHFYIVPGNSFSKYVRPEAEENLPSESYTHHFCEIDRNAVHGINTTYVVQSNSKAQYKFLLVGNATEQFELVDLYGVLEIR